MCWLVVFGLSLVSASRLAEACPICNIYPQKTAADFLIESQYVVFAREDPQRPFSYKAIKILKGDPVTTDINLFVNSTARHLLRARENYVAVVYRTDENSAWRTLGIANENYQQVVRRILAFAPDWNGASGAEKRQEFFLSLFGHADRELFELAYLELGRAPYSTIKRVARLTPKEDLRPLFQQRQYFKWRPLAILMLAQDASEQDQRYIKDSFEDCSRFSLTTNLAAWATAYIELNQDKAIDRIEQEYLSNPSRTAEEIRAVVTALSIHGRQGHTQLRNRIVRSYNIAVRTHPAISQRVAMDIMQWNHSTNRVDVREISAQDKIEFTNRN